MSSILTNNSAMVALQTMKSISANLSKTTADISTGKSVASAKDNAAVWAISKVMEADVTGFKGISDSLALGSSTVAVARQASETVTSLLTTMKEKIVSAQNSNVDRAKIQTDIDALKSTISTVVGGAQFNGLNLVDGSQTTVDILASLNRSGTAVTTSSIAVTAQDLSVGPYVAKAVLTGTVGTGASTGGASGNADAASFPIDGNGGTGTVIFDETTDQFAAGDSISVSIAGQSTSYTVTAEDAAATTTGDLVAIGLKKSIEALGITGLTVDYDSGSPGQLTITNNTQKYDDSLVPVLVDTDINVALQFKNAGSGALGALTAINVTTSAGAQLALSSVETMLQTAITASASFGSAQTRIDTQKDFVTKLTDSMKAGIGSLVDTDMEEASARLQALQVQQQLSTQALSIANQQPQSLLSLFR